ncbi:MAG TPA: 5-formyltetrahydrofolate cyclo-ligase [Sphingomicrobium sp.]
MPLGKDALRIAALDARKALVATMSDAQRALLERRLGERLTALCAKSKIVAGYAPIGSEISPLPAMEEARAVGAIIAFPAFTNPGKPFKFLAGEPSASGPFGIFQPKPSAVAVEPDLILVPLIAIDGHGTRVGRGKGHYDRVLAPLKRKGARIVGVGWSTQMLATIIPRDPWDVPMDGFACPESLIWFG